MKKCFLFFGILLMISIGSHAQMYVYISIAQPGVDECIEASIESYKKNDFLKIHPNPAKNLLYISWENSFVLGESTVEIYNQTGQKILTRKFKPENIRNTSINVSHLYKGVYSLKIYCNSFNSIQKFIIE